MKITSCCSVFLCVVLISFITKSNAFTVNAKENETHTEIAELEPISTEYGLPIHNEIKENAARSKRSSKKLNEGCAAASNVGIGVGGGAAVGAASGAGAGALIGENPFLT